MIYYEPIADQAKSGTEAAKELWKMALRRLKEAEQRKSDAVLKMTRI
jgi:hypothetical protein